MSADRSPWPPGTTLEFIAPVRSDVQAKRVGPFGAGAASVERGMAHFGYGMVSLGNGAARWRGAGAVTI
jgi:hypothetical protein